MTEQIDLLFDADVLIDFCSVDRKIIRKISDNLGCARVAREVLREVNDLTEKQCEGLNLLVETPTESEVNEALSLDEPLSFQDKLTLVMARDRGWTCITNDRKLRRTCMMRDVKSRRGLSLIVDTVRLGAMNESDAVGLAEEIGKINNISDRVIQKIMNAISESD
jgi:hypothetical protein